LTWTNPLSTTPPVTFVDGEAPALSAEVLNPLQATLLARVESALTSLAAYGDAQLAAAVLGGGSTTPVNTGVPVISGTPTVGLTLTCTTGTWLNATSFSYQWQRCSTAGGAFANVSAATLSTYTLQSGDAGYYFRCQVTDSDSAGSASAVSAVTAAVAAAVSAPVFSAAPSISGATTVGSVLTASSGTASGSPTFAYQWNRNNTSISGATSSTYTLQSADGGYTLTVTVTATNSGGAASATSAATGVITAAPATSTQPVRCLNAHPMFESYPNGGLDQQFCPALLTAGAQAVRWDLVWYQMQKSRPASGSNADVLASVMANDPGQSYSSGAIYLARFDYAMQWAAQNGVKVMLMVSYPPAWSQTSGTVETNAPPTSWQDYINFVVFLAKRYSTGGAGVVAQYGSALESMEFWNEPDLNYSWDNSLNSGTTAGNASAYVAGLKLVYPALKAAVPSLLVVAPAVSFSTYDQGPNAGNVQYDWLTDFYAANPVGYYDVLTIHCYGDPPSHNGLGAADSPAQVVADWSAYIWPTVSANDPGARVWVTEVGWNTGPNGVTTAAQATDLTGVYAALAACTQPHVERSYWYSLVDEGNGTTSSDNAGNYGLFDTNWAAKPSLAAFQVLGGSATTVPASTVAAAPKGLAMAGIATPSAGWTVAFADGFGELDTTLWTPNSRPGATNGPGDNNNDVTIFNPSQVSITPNGLVLTCTYENGVGGNNAAGEAINWLSGYMQTTPASSVAGMASKGFYWKPDLSTYWAFEWVGTFPYNPANGGLDASFWACSDPYTVEIDLFEIFNFTPGAYNALTPITWIYNTSNGASNQDYESTPPSACTDQAQHVWTWLFNPSAKTVQCYIDGVKFGTGISYPSTMPVNFMNLITEYNMRGSAPGFTSGSRTMTVRSIAAYCSGSSPSFQGGGIAAGTTVGATSGSGGGSTSNPSFSTLTAFDSADFYYAAGITQSGNSVAVPIASNAYLGFNAPAARVFTGASKSCELTLASAGNGTKQMYFAIGDQASGSQNAVGWEWNGASLIPYYTVSGTTTNGTTIAVTGSVYVKVAENAGQTIWSYSTNGGSTWTVAQTLTDPLSSVIMAACYLNGSAGSYGTETTSTATFSNLA
jgi:hypothetical protein